MLLIRRHNRARCQADNPLIPLSEIAEPLLLHRYLAEFDFRYNNRIAKGVNDEARAIKAVEGVVGKRLTYRTVD